MKSIILTSVMSLLSMFSYSQSYEKLWKQVEQFESDGKPKSAYSQAEKILKKATSAKDRGQAVSARLKMAALHQEWSPDSFFTDIRELEALRAGEKKPEAKAVYASLLAELYQMNRGRTQAAGLDLSSDDIREWTREQYDSAAVRNWELSMQDLSALASARSKDWLPFITQEKQSALFNHDLLHVLWKRAQEQDDDIWRNTRRTKAGLAKAVADEYRRRGNREAALLVSLDWVRWQTETSSEEALNQLKEEFADLPLCAEVYLRMISNTYKSERRVELARECIKRYPGYERIGEVRNKLNEQLKPSVRWQGRSYYYPGKTYEWTVHSNNAERVKFEILRMPDSFRHSELPDKKKERLQALRDKGTPVEDFSIDLAGRQPWEERSDTIRWKALKPGIYAMIITGETSEPEAETRVTQEYTCFNCTRLQPISQDGLGGLRTIVVDGETGHPVAGARVEYYLGDEGKDLVGTATTDAEGRARLCNDSVAVEHSTYLYRRITTPDDLYLGDEGLYLDKNEREQVEDSETHLRLYADRSIYRPGQEVHIGGIIYRQQHWQASVVKEAEVRLTLCDANGKEVAAQDAVSDEMGKISADFVLPQGGLPGTYTLYARFDKSVRYSSSLALSVEEYKRPTFEVTMDEAPDMQWPADAITLTGKAMGYNGVPVREGRVTGTYQFTYPYWWYRRSNSERFPIDTLQTDENGCFSVRVPLTSLSDEALWGGLAIQLEVDVLSVAGETREGSTTVPLCKKPLRLMLSVPEKQDRDRLRPVAMELLSSTGRPTDGAVEWAIFSTVDRERTSEEAVMSGRLKSTDKQLCFDVSQLSSLAAGQYEFYAKATSGANSDSTRCHFIIFGMADKRLPEKTANWLYCPENTFSPAHPAHVQIGTSFEDVALYYSIVAGREVVAERLLRLSNELRVIDIPYEERFGDGATFHYCFVKEGQVYDGSQSLRLQHPDNDLKWEWKTFRDRLHPGDTETWTLSLRRPDGTPANAQVMATLYDASLDALKPHAWNLFMNFAYNITSLPWRYTDYFTQYYTSEQLAFGMKVYHASGFSFDEFNRDMYSALSFQDRLYYGGRRFRGPVMVESMAAPPMAEPMMMAKAAVTADSMNSADEMAEDEADAGAGAAELPALSSATATLRTNFNETAAFMPRLHTDARGEVAITFTLPESLTTWKMLGIAHTQDMLRATFHGEAVARKELMARLYLPRFLHADDKASVRAVIQNMTAKAMAGSALLEIFDPETERVIVSKRQPYTAEANGETLLTFDYTPGDEYTVVAVRLTATSNTFSDGEQHYLPILPSKTFVTESVEIRADSLGTFTTDLSTLFNKDNPSATHRRLTIEYTTHPIWYALQALPSLTEPQHDDIISLGTALQAQALSTYIANTTPRLKTLVEIWQREQAQGQPALASRLAEDEELKQIILDETPWLREAEGEADRKARLIQLFDLSRQSATLTSVAARLQRRLESDGGFAWFPGMKSSETMTRVVASELARLVVMTHDFATLPPELKSAVHSILKRNLGFIGERTAKHVQEMKKQEQKGEKVNTASMMFLEYVYTTQHAGVELSSAQKADVKYLLDHMKGSVASMSNWERAIAAVVMKGDGRTKEARQYYESLLEHTTTTADHGTFFDYAGGSFTPTSHKVIHHVAAMEAAHVMEPANDVLRRGLQRWLLQQKRTQMWESNICTVDAIYALMLGSEESLQASQPDDITLRYATREVKVSRKDADAAVAGLGFIKQQFTDGEAPGEITVERHTDSEAWGAVFATYLTPMTDASASATGLTVRRELSSTTPRVGERLVTRYVITADRDYEYVRLSAGRPACAEPAEQRSGYQWRGGLGYYRAVRDSRTDYFFDHLPKGTYVLEEAAFIDRAGQYTTGLTTIRCHYAAEYGGNTAAVELKVEE